MKEAFQSQIDRFLIKAEMELIDIYLCWSHIGEISAICTYRVFERVGATYRKQCLTELESTVEPATVTVQFHRIVGFQTDSLWHERAGVVVMSWTVFSLDQSTLMQSVKQRESSIDETYQHHRIEHSNETTFDIMSRQAVLLEAGR